MSYIAAYVTFPNENDAKIISDILLSKKIIACYNLSSVKSSYWWGGKIETSPECVSLMKTRKNNWDVLKSEILKNHPYEIPCIMKFEVEANDEYEKRVDDETTILFP